MTLKSRPRLELVVGAVYRARSPKMVTPLDGVPQPNDRVLVWVSPNGGMVSYNSTVTAGRWRSPTVSARAFRYWASHRVEENTE